MPGTESRIIPVRNLKLAETVDHPANKTILEELRKARQHLDKVIEELEKRNGR